MREKLSTDAIEAILKAHGYWLRGEGGESANLSYANLSSADLSYADLSYANLRYANLRYANLSSANLSYANLSSANLRYANLRSANLRSADLSSANLRSADLSYADLSSANLSSADLRSAKASDNLIYIRTPICISGTRYNVQESARFGILIGCEQDVTSEKLPALFEKHSTPEGMRPLYIASVRMIEEYAAKFPLCEEVK